MRARSSVRSCFSPLSRRPKLPRDRYHLGTLLQLESETKARLRPLLFKHGVSLDEAADLSLLELAISRISRHGVARNSLGLMCQWSRTSWLDSKPSSRWATKPIARPWSQWFDTRPPYSDGATIEARDGIVDGSLDDVISR